MNENEEHDIPVERDVMPVEPDRTDAAPSVPTGTTTPMAGVPDLTETAEESASEEEEPASEELASPEEPAPAPVAPNLKKWYVLKVQTNREDTIKAAVERRIKIEGLESYYGQILVPTSKTMEQKKSKDGKISQVAKYTKKFPGYLFVEVEFNDPMLLLFRETSGVGDFVGNKLNRIPLPMTDKEVERLQADSDGRSKDADGKEKAKPKFVINFSVGDAVRMQGGAFDGMDGRVKEIIEPRDEKEMPKVKVEVSIWGRPVVVDAEPNQVEVV